MELSYVDWSPSESPTPNFLSKNMIDQAKMEHHLHSPHPYRNLPVGRGLNSSATRCNDHGRIWDCSEQWSTTPPMMAAGRPRSRSSSAPSAKREMRLTGEWGWQGNEADRGMRLTGNEADRGRRLTGEWGWEGNEADRGTRLTGERGWQGNEVDRGTRPTRHDTCRRQKQRTTKEIMKKISLLTICRHNLPTIVTLLTLSICWHKWFNSPQCYRIAGYFRGWKFSWNAVVTINFCGSNFCTHIRVIVADDVIWKLVHVYVAWWSKYVQLQQKCVL